MDRFQDLMRRYLQRSLSQEERLEFFQLLAEQKHVPLLDELVKEISKEEDVDLILRERFDDNYAKIRSALNLASEEHSVPAEPPSEGKTIHVRWTHTWYARAAAIIIIAMAAGILILSKRTKVFNPFSAEQEVQLSRFQGKQLVDLPDGTKVVLNDNSELNFNGETFDREAREVNLIGEATFDVVHNSSKPFVVHTGKVSTKVLGTEFNINAYPERDKITVTVLRGLVEVGDGQHVYGQIKPNEQIAVDVHSSEFIQLKTNAEDAVHWKQNFIVLDDVDLEQAAAIIGKKFNVKITLENPELKKCRIMVRFLNNETLETVLSVISKGLGVNYSIEKDGNVVLRGNGCN